MRDGLHPTVKGYQVWADGLKPLLTRIARAARKNGRSTIANGRPCRIGEVDALGPWLDGPHGDGEIPAPPHDPHLS